MNGKILISMVIIPAMLLSAALLMFPAKVEAKADVVPVEGINYNVNSSMTDNLKSLIGKKVYVTLDSGKIFAGFIKDVGMHFIHLEKLEGKDFFDALIRIEDISAIDVRFREYRQ